MPSVYYSSQVSTRSRDAAAHEHENGPAVSFNFYTWDSALYNVGYKNSSRLMGTVTSYI
jgi:hypothetical protein